MASQEPLRDVITLITNNEFSNEVGLGGPLFRFAFYIQNRPPFTEYETLNCIRPLVSGELHYIVQHSSNHWRKAFNVYAKVLEALGETPEGMRWQEYRDSKLLQSGSSHALMFSKPDIKKNAIHVVAGKGYAQKLNFDFPIVWVNEYFAIAKDHKLIVSPYLDYRQLSNERIDFLVGLVKELDQ